MQAYQECTVFFSWQSDNKGARNFISAALEKVQKKLKGIGVESAIDRDTSGIPGSPDIARAIFDKIDACDIFVADVSFINSAQTLLCPEARKTPNPNVLIELGYAVKSLGEARIILLADLQCGPIGEMPFDISHKRIVGFSLDGKDAKERANEKERVAGLIATTISQLHESGNLKRGLNAMQARNNLAILLRRAMRRFATCYMLATLNEALSINDRETDRKPSEEQAREILERARFLREQDDKAHIDFSEDWESWLKAAAGSVPDRLIGEAGSALKNLERVLESGAKGRKAYKRLVIAYIDKLYCDYGQYMDALDPERILTKRFIDLHNGLSTENELEFEERRLSEAGEVIFDSNPRELVVYDRSRRLLLRGSFGEDEDDFSGYMDNRYEAGRYRGEYEHGRFNGRGKKYGTWSSLLQEGTWVDGKHELGMEYDWLMMVKSGNLTFNREAGEYDADDDFSYALYEQYGDSVMPFGMSYTAIEYEGIERFFVVDRELLPDNMEQISNIRPLADFLEQRDPALLARLRKRHEILD